MIFASFWTGNGYQAQAERLTASLNAFGLRNRVERIEDRGSWQECIAFKPQFILRCLASYRCPVVWIDADCEVKALPSLLFTGAHDFAAYNWRADPLNPLHAPYDPQLSLVSGGVMLFGYTAPAMELLMRWDGEQCARPEILDDPALDSVLHNHRPPVRCLWLPRSYNRMADKFPETEPVIDHHYKNGRHRIEQAA